MLTGGLCFGSGFMMAAAGVHIHSIGRVAPNQEQRMRFLSETHSNFLISIQLDALHL